MSKRAKESAYLCNEKMIAQNEECIWAIEKDMALLNTRNSARTANGCSADSNKACKC